MSSDIATGQEIETLTLGAEWDDDLIKTLKQSLLDLGAEAIDSNWSVGGSQEIATEKWKLDNDLIKRHDKNIKIHASNTSNVR